MLLNIKGGGLSERLTRQLQLARDLGTTVQTLQADEGRHLGERKLQAGQGV